MILLFNSKYHLDSNVVIAYLLSKDINFLRVTENSVLDIHLDLNTQTTQCVLSIDKQAINVNSVSSFWSYKTDISFEKRQYSIAKADRHLSTLDTELKSFLFTFLEDNVRYLGNYNNETLNKLWVLLEAKECEIDIPKTTVTAQKQVIIDFLKNNEAITKSIKFLSSFVKDDYLYSAYTSEISQERIEKIASFFPSLIQEKLNKKYELRIFFMYSKYFPMAIFSQNDPQTNVDFRHYNDTKPNRAVPYILPKEIEKKLKKLMQKLGLNTGSIDMVVTKDNRYVFLEVNPVGQFGMVSYPCNYYLEKKIATFLSDESGKRKY